MRRRAFISLLGGALAAWPLTTHAQQGAQTRRIGVLTPLGIEDPDEQAAMPVFLQSLKQLGWVEGHNLQIDYRSTGGSLENSRKYAAELVGLAPDVILAIRSVNMPALLQATRTVPIVFLRVPDPVGGGFVDSLARPGGNATSFTSFEYSMSTKWLKLLKELAPGVKRAGVLRDPTLAVGTGQHYDLHAWLFKNNPLGMFAPTNPDVSCEGYDFALLEKPTKMMPGQANNLALRRRGDRIGCGGQQRNAYRLTRAQGPSPYWQRQNR